VRSSINVGEARNQQFRSLQKDLDLCILLYLIKLPIKKTKQLLKSAPCGIKTAPKYRESNLIIIGFFAFDDETTNTLPE
jgi:hypothetical protein